MKKGRVAILAASLALWVFAGAGVSYLAGCGVPDVARTLEETSADSEESKKQESGKSGASDKESEEFQGLSLRYRIVEGEQASQEDIIDTMMKLQERAEIYCDNAIVYQTEADVICVDLPEVCAPDYVSEQMGRNGRLYFIAQTDFNGNENYSGQSITGANGEVQWGYGLNFSIEELVANGSVVLTGTDIAASRAVAAQDAMGITSFTVQLDMTDEGAGKFAVATERAWEKGETIAIYFDGEFLSVPSVNGKITDGRAVITSMNSMEEAEAIASAIQIGGLKLELEQF